MDRKQVLETNFALATVSVILFFITKEELFIYIAAGLGLFTLFFPLAASYFSRTWMKLAKFLGEIVSRIVLTVIYLFILVPVSFLYRITRKKVQISTKESFFIKREGKIGPEHFLNPW